MQKAFREFSLVVLDEEKTKACDKPIYDVMRCCFDLNTIQSYQEVYLDEKKDARQVMVGTIDDTFVLDLTYDEFHKIVMEHFHGEQDGLNNTAQL